jgi:hypothetical protein
MCYVVRLTERWSSQMTATCAFPVEQAREHVPIGVINPSRNYLAGDLRGTVSTGAGRHWWARLTSGDLKAHQLPDPVGQYQRPVGW